MGLRRQARELTVQFLFQSDFVKHDRLESALLAFWTITESYEAIKPAVKSFALGLIKGVVENMPQLDKKISELADNWDFDRLALVDRNVLRLALYEMLFRPEIPPVVSINEAIEVAKKFGSEDSGKFVNGILDRAKKDLLRPARQASGESTVHPTK